MERDTEGQVNMCFLSQVIGVGRVTGMGLLLPIAEEDRSSDEQGRCS